MVKTVKCDAVLEYLFCNGRRGSTRDVELFQQIDSNSIYEVIKLINGVPLFFEDHVQRLLRSAEMLGERIEKSVDEIRAEIDLLIEANRQADINVKLVWNRVDDRSVFLTYFTQQDFPEKSAYQTGVNTVLYSGQRENPHLKAVSSSFRERAKGQRDAVGAYEALLVNENGYITEGSRSNIFFLVEEQLFTPPSQSVLLGVTRHHVLNLCREMALPVQKKLLHRDELPGLDGAFITGTTIDILPVGSIDDLRLHSASHPSIKKIQHAFAESVKAYIKSKISRRSSSYLSPLTLN